jgi:hypothetical protein
MEAVILCWVGVHKWVSCRQYWMHQSYTDGSLDHTPIPWIQEWKCARTGCRATKFG